jgi:mannosyl-oligosaccharide alpha-1,2-mannosidase
MHRIKTSRRVLRPDMSRQHKRIIANLLLGAFVFGAFYVLYAEPIDDLAVPFEAHEQFMRDHASIAASKSRQSYDWRDAPFHNTIDAYTSLPSSLSGSLPRIQHVFAPETRLQRERRERRRVSVRNEFKRSWDSYRTYAWTKDELKPITGTSDKSFGGWGATLVDSLDTLWIMGMKDEFFEAVKAVALIDFGESEVKSVSVFETTIRYLGGLISAYDLSHQPVLLEKAVQLGEMLYRAFDTENHMPLNWLNLERAKLPRRVAMKAESSICFACVGSLTMEFTRLAQITSEPKYYDIVARISALLDEKQGTTKIPGLFPTMIDARKAEFNQSRIFSIGALADSSYEYFPKMHALLGGSEPVYKKLYADSAAMIDRYMLFRPMIPDSELGQNLLLCGDAYTSRPGDVELSTEMQHLTCFIGGMFGLAGRLFSNSSHVELGENLTRGCIYAYAATPTGVMPEIFKTQPCASRISCPWNETKWNEGVLWSYGTRHGQDAELLVEQYGLPQGFTHIRDRRYLLRPEAIESVFVMHRITGDPAYLDAAWDMFTSIVKASRTQYANGQVIDVTGLTPEKLGYEAGDQYRVKTRAGNVENKMESFWTAETLKYFYLVFSTPDMMSLDDWVFNTEAHPFRRS